MRITLSCLVLPRSIGVLEQTANCFTQDWGGVERNYCFPPRALVAPTLQHARACRARITFIVLGWRSAPWWPLLSGSVESGRGFAPFVWQQLYFPAGREVLVPGLASHDRFFEKGVPISDVFALDIDFTSQVILLLSFQFPARAAHPSVRLCRLI